MGRSILIIVWHLLNGPAARYRDLGPAWHARHTDRSRNANAHPQLEALGYDVIVTFREDTAWPPSTGNRAQPPGLGVTTRHEAIPPSVRTAATPDCCGGYFLVSLTCGFPASRLPTALKALHVQNPGDT